MSRINPINKENADPKALEIVAAVKKALGIVPNMVATMAQSPAVASAYVGFSHALSQGSLSAEIRERIALTVAEEDACGYCLAAHTFLGKKAGLKEDEILNARRGTRKSRRLPLPWLLPPRLSSSGDRSPMPMSPQRAMRDSPTEKSPRSSRMWC